MLLVLIHLYFHSLEDLLLLRQSVDGPHILHELLDGCFSDFFSSCCPCKSNGDGAGSQCRMPRSNWAFAWCSHSAVSPCREELCWLLENSMLKSQLGRLQQELRLAKEKGSEHNG